MSCLSKMELDVEYNLARQVSQFVNHDKLWEHEEVQVDKLSLTKYQCPCNNCHESKVLLWSTIKQHLQKFGCDDYFIKSILVSINNSLFFICFHYNVSKNIDKVIHYIVVVVVGQTTPICGICNEFIPKGFYCWFPN